MEGGEGPGCAPDHSGIEDCLPLHPISSMAHDRSSQGGGPYQQDQPQELLSGAESDMNN